MIEVIHPYLSLGPHDSNYFTIYYIEIMEQNKINKINKTQLLKMK
jgi:hypothetical protein